MMKKSNRMFSILFLSLLIFFSSFVHIVAFKQYDLDKSFEESTNYSPNDNNSQFDFSDIGFDVEKVEYSSNLDEMDINSGGGFVTENNFDYVGGSVDVTKGDLKAINGRYTPWSEDPDDSNCFEVVVEDESPFTVPLIAYYYTMEVTFYLVSHNTFTKQDNPLLGGSITWAWDIDGHEIGTDANLYYTYGSLKVVSGTGHSLDVFSKGDSLDVSVDGDPAFRKGTTTISNFDSIIGSDDRIRLKVYVYTKGFVNWWVVEDKDVYADIEIHGLSARQDLIPIYHYDNNMDFRHSDAATGCEIRAERGVGTAWSENPGDDKYLEIVVGDQEASLGWYEWLYYMKAKVYLVSHNTFTKTDDPNLGGAISWKWDVDGHERGNDAKLHYSKGWFEITSGSGYTLDSYTMGSYDDKKDEGDPSTRQGTTFIPNFDSIIHSDGKIYFTITVEAYGWVNWWGIEDKDVYIDIEVFGLSAKQVLQPFYNFQNDFDYLDYYVPSYSEKRDLNGRYSHWSEDPGDSEILELVVGDKEATLGWYEWLFHMRGELYMVSHNKFFKQNDPLLGGEISWTYDLTGHERGDQANLYRSRGGLYIIKPGGTKVALDEFSEGTSDAYHENGDPARRTGTIYLNNLDSYIHSDNHLHFCLKGEGWGWVNWWIVETKDVYIDLEMWGLSVTQEIKYLPDISPPDIVIGNFFGDRTDGNPGTWYVDAYDEESGIDDTSIKVYIDNILVGTSLGFYAIPNSLGDHTIRVELSNNHPVHPLSTTKSNTVHIVDDDTQPPIIDIQYIGSGHDSNPGYFEWYIEDFDSSIGGDYDIGFSDITIRVTYVSTDGTPNFSEYIPGSTLGTWNLLPYLGVYTIDIFAKDNDDDRGILLDSLSTQILNGQSVYDDDISPPVVNIDYVGDGTDGNPGYFEWSVFDWSGIYSLVIEIYYESTEGYDSYLIQLPPVTSGEWYLPHYLGFYKISIYARDNDNDRGIQLDSLVTRLEKQQTIVDDDTDSPILEDLSISQDFQLVNISVKVTDESGISAFNVYVENELVTPIYFEVSNDYYYIMLDNEWNLLNGTYDVEVQFFDADDDRPGDVLDSSIFGSFVIPISQSYQYVIQLIEELKIYIDDEFRCIDWCLIHKLSLAQEHLSLALDYLEAGSMPLVMIHDEIAQIYVLLTEIITEFFDWISIISDEQAEFIITSLHEIRDNIVLLKGQSLGTQESYKIAEIIIDLYHVNDYIEDDLCCCHLNNIRCSIHSVIVKLDFALFVIAIEHDPDYILTEVKWDLDNIIYDIYSKVVDGRISLELAETLVSMIDEAYAKIHSLL